ncbi:hypothetical protein [Pararhodonellum marinum]|uniref:hypothetical protein n=1 Tax=Pararhodonellum marinum TaxID=2755358 RepID=UPI001890034C|nr:hypothetical protein [Pararhodonellum marinum]
MNQRSRFYLIITILLLLVVLLGFGPRFYLRPFFEQPRHLQMEQLPIYLILHGVLMTLWYALLVMQSALVNTKNIKFHMRLGWGLGVIAILAVIFAIPVMMGFAPRMQALGFLDVHNTERLWLQNVMWTNDLLALITFAGMVVIGFLNSNIKPLHRTMMLFASMAFTGPATGRMFEWMAPSLFMEGTVLLFVLFPLSVVIHDWVKEGKFPKYPCWGLLALLLMISLTFLLPSFEFWTALFKSHLG